jgi:hypothetical protein
VKKQLIQLEIDMMRMQTDIILEFIDFLLEDIPEDITGEQNDD